MGRNHDELISGGAGSCGEQARSNNESNSVLVNFILPSLSNPLYTGQRFDRRRNCDFMLRAWERLSRRCGAIREYDLQSSLVCHLKSPERRCRDAAGTLVSYSSIFWNLTQAATKKN